MKVLIAEDDSFIANAYRVKLKKEGFEANIVTDGEQVVVALAEFQPDVILLDLIMPNKDGFTVLTELKADEKFKDIPVIVASNLGQTQDQEKAQELGAEDYIVKSNVSLDEIVAKLRSYAPGNDSKKTSKKDTPKSAKKDTPKKASKKAAAQSKEVAPAQPKPVKTEAEKSADAPQSDSDEDTHEIQVTQEDL